MWCASFSAFTEIGEVFADDNAAVLHLHAKLLRNLQACGADFMRKRILVDLFQKPRASALSTVNAQPIACSDSLFNLSPSACIRVHLLKSALKLFLAMLPPGDWRRMW